MSPAPTWDWEHPYPGGPAVFTLDLPRPLHAPGTPGYPPSPPEAKMWQIDAFVLADEVDADDLVMKLRAARQAALDELLGTPPIEGFEGQS